MHSAFAPAILVIANLICPLRYYIRGLSSGVIVNCKAHCQVFTPELKHGKRREVRNDLSLLCVGA